MIDFEFAMKSFKEYLNDYDIEDANIKLKLKHTYKVIEKSEYIAEELNLDEENIKLAKLIGLLHDIGRFEQVKKTLNFDDTEKFDHGNYAVEILFSRNLIRNFVQDDKYDNIIKKAIFNHNKYAIEEGLEEAELLHSKIIRDADKLDDFRVKEEEHFENIFPGKYNADTIEYEVITDKVYDDFMNHKIVKSSDRITQIDFWISILAFIYDLNFEVSLRYIRDEKYIDRLIDRINYKNDDTNAKMQHIRECANNFLMGR